MFDFGGADADGHGTERAVRGSVRIAAHDRHARLRQTQHRRERVHHALIGVSQRAQTYAEILAVLFERAQLQCGNLIRIRAVDVGSRSVVIFRCDQLVKVTRLASGQSQAFECLRTGDFVHEHQINVQQVGSPITTPAYQMIGPDLLGQCRSHCGTSSSFLTFSSRVLPTRIIRATSLWCLSLVRMCLCRYMRYLHATHVSCMRRVHVNSR